MLGTCIENVRNIVPLVHNITNYVTVNDVANVLGHIVLLDPVGAGASALRTGTAVKIMDEIRLDVIRGNISEIKTLAQGSD